jgi:hypothetical protein
MVRNESYGGNKPGMTYGVQKPTMFEEGIGTVERSVILCLTLTFSCQTTFISGYHE